MKRLAGRHAPPEKSRTDPDQDRLYYLKPASWVRARVLSLAEKYRWRIPRLPTTHVTLLAQLRQDPSDQAGWDEFVDRYGPHIYRWCRQWKLQDADALDVTQDILVKLAQKLRAFAYDPSRSFRGWLKTVAHHAWRDFEDSRRRAQPAAGNSQVQELMLCIEARDDFAQKLEAAFDLELLETAKVRVRLRVAPHTWEAFLS